MLFLLSLLCLSMTLLSLITPALAIANPLTIPKPLIPIHSLDKYDNCIYGLATTQPKMLPYACTQNRTQSASTPLTWDSQGCEIPQSSIEVEPIVNLGFKGLDYHKIFAQQNSTMMKEYPYSDRKRDIHIWERCPVEEYTYTCGAFYTIESVRVKGWMTPGSLKDLLPGKPKPKDEDDDKEYEVDFWRLWDTRFQEDERFGVVNGEYEICVCPNFPGSEYADSFSLDICPDWCPNPI